MSTLIIYTHPYDESFNHHILESITENISDEIDIIDLYKDNFNLIYSSEELSLFKEGKTLSPIVKDYQDRVLKASKIICIFPIWWNDIPGILKNFFDLVMKKNFGYVDTPRGVLGKLNTIESITVISTSNSPTWYIKYFCGNSIKKVFLNATCKQLGIKNRDWINLGNIKNISNEDKDRFLSKVNQFN